MSHSTEIKIEIGLDSYHLHCGSRHPALAHNGAGRMALFGVLYSEAEENKALYAGDTGWLKVEIIHCT